MKRNICFRADANAQIGYGHFIRTLALADMLKDDFDCVFYTAEPSPYQIGEMEKVCQYIPLSEETKFEDFIAMLNGSEIVVLDNYFFTTDYQKEIKAKGCKLVCIDDMHDKHYVADAIINHGPVSSDEFDKEPYTRLFLGDGYKLLRAPFLRPLSNKSRTNNVVVNLGGADPFRLTDKVVSLLLQVQSSYHILVILGDTVFLSDENRNRVEVRSKLTAEQMAEVFETSSFGILPGSTVSIEAMSRAMPILMGYQVDNQEEGYKKTLSKGLFIPLGNLHELTLETLRSSIGQLNSFNAPVLDTTMIKGNCLHLFKSL